MGPPLLSCAMSKISWRSTVKRLVRVLPGLIRGPHATDVFRRLEAAGVHLTPVHFHQPVPEVRALPEALWRTGSAMPGVDLNPRGQLRRLRGFRRFRREVAAIPADPTGEPTGFHLRNGAFEGTDALAYYCMIRSFRPRTVLEVGSGYSTLLAAQAARRNGRTRVIAVEPYPRPFLRRGVPGLARLIRRPVQEVGLAPFLRLKRGDILFIDSSHVSRIGSDVNFLFLEVLPRLRPGVIVHLHDIFFPGDYPREFVKERLYFWNEQYLLQAFLAFNRAWEVLLCNSWLGRRHRPLLRSIFPTSVPWWGGGSFWMRRK